MGEEPEQIEREIELSREKLDADLTALEEKVSPKRVAARAKDRTRDKATEVKDRVADAATAAKHAAGSAKDKVVGPVTTAGPSERLNAPEAARLDAAEWGPTEWGPTEWDPTKLDSATLDGPKLNSAKLNQVKDKVGSAATATRAKAANLAGTAREQLAGSNVHQAQEAAGAAASRYWTTVREGTRRKAVMFASAAFAAGWLLGRIGRTDGTA